MKTGTIFKKNLPVDHQEKILLRKWIPSLQQPIEDSIP